MEILKKERINEYCAEYEKKIAKQGGIDFQLLGIGRTGHIGFNEPGSNYDSLTRLVHLDYLTRNDARKAFFWNRKCTNNCNNNGN